MANLLHAWQKFMRGKSRKPAVKEFWLHLERNLSTLHTDLVQGKYHHEKYIHFVVADPKRRDIYVPIVHDRIVHQALADFLEIVYTPLLYQHSYAAQRGKGVHAARAYTFSVMKRLYGHGHVWVAKLDVKKYFDHIDHIILLSLLARRVTDSQILGLLAEVLSSFGAGCGVPLGNLTSQWFGTIYLHELDYFIKHILRVKYYTRYNDDLIIVGQNYAEILQQVGYIRQFVQWRLHLLIPDEKVSVVRLPEAVDILGVRTDGQRFWLRPVTRRRAQAKIDEALRNLDPNYFDKVSSYYGMSH